MNVRPAQLADLNICYEMDKGYATDYVWQMQSHEGERGIDIRFDTVRLPRTMKVEYPRLPEDLLVNWQEEACFLVAEDDSGQVIAFLDMVVQPWHNASWIRNLVVDPRHRRQGVATSLLRSARHWANENEMSKILLEAQTKNYPAIRFAQKQGFVYCGYNDRYYATGDIAVFFAVGV